MTDQSSRYELYLSTLSMSELRDIARESKVIGYSKYRKAGLVWYLSRQTNSVKRSLSERMFPEAMRAWVGLFTKNKNITDHYTDVILSILNNIGYFSKGWWMEKRFKRFCLRHFRNN